MFRRFASKALTLAPLFTRGYIVLNALKPASLSQTLSKPMTAGFGLAQARTFADAGADDAVKELTKPEDWENYAKKVSDEKPVIVEFFAKYVFYVRYIFYRWCGHCRTLTPVMERKVKAQGGKILLLKVNVDKCPELAGEMGVSSIPHAFLRYKGKFVDSMILFLDYIFVH